MVSLHAGAQAGGAELVAFPKLAAARLNNPHDRPSRSRAGVTAKISGIAAEQGLHPVCGLQNPSEILPMTLPSWSHRAGKISTYRKTHLTTAERSWASAGDVRAVIDTPFGGRVGLLIGRDVSFPEAGRLRGCDLMSCRDVPPIPIGGDPHHWRHFHVRGGENKILRIRERVRCRELLLSTSTPAISASSIRERRQAKGISSLCACRARVVQPKPSNF